MSSPAFRLPLEEPRQPLARLRSCWNGTIPLELLRGDYLYLPGDPSRSVFPVREGFVRLARLLGDCRRRLAGALLDLAGRFGADEAGGRWLGLCLTHEDLARLIGATGESVTPLLVELRRAGVLHYDRRRLLIRGPRRLRDLAAGR